MQLPGKIVDISMTLDDVIVVDPPAMRPSIKMMEHGDNLDRCRKLYPGLDTDDLPGGVASAYETITLATHNGTHVDAPKHYHPVDKNGDPMKGIDEMPLDWFMRPGVKFDFRHFADGYLVTEADIEAELKRIGHDLQPLEIVVGNTSAAAAYAPDSYNDRRCGIGPKATLHRS